MNLQAYRSHAVFTRSSFWLTTSISDTRNDQATANTTSTNKRFYVSAAIVPHLAGTSIAPLHVCTAATLLPMATAAHPVLPFVCRRQLSFASARSCGSWVAVWWALPCHCRSRLLVASSYACRTNVSHHLATDCFTSALSFTALCACLTELTLFAIAPIDQDSSVPGRPHKAFKNSTLTWLAMQVWRSMLWWPVVTCGTYQACRHSTNVPVFHDGAPICFLYKVWRRAWPNCLVEFVIILSAWRILLASYRAYQNVIVRHMPKLSSFTNHLQIDVRKCIRTLKTHNLWFLIPCNLFIPTHKYSAASKVLQRTDLMNVHYILVWSISCRSREYWLILIRMVWKKPMIGLSILI